jgi:hypothetical protein
MWILFFSLLILSCCLIFIGKAIADIVSNEVSWNQSIFSDFGSEESYWGHKDATWVRKDHDNLILNYLFHTIFVFITDLWHTANTLNRIGIYLSVLFSILLGSVITITFWNIFWVLISIISVNVVGFHIFYHYVLRWKKAEQ